MRLSEFDYNLPDELIAQFPAEKRDNSNLMVLNNLKQTFLHKKFYDIADFLDKDDILVLNNTKVIPARLLGKKTTGANIEIFLLKKTDENVWECLIKPSKRVKEGTIIEFSEELHSEILKKTQNDKWIVKFNYEGDFFKLLDKNGKIPLPPYISRDNDDYKQLDCERYQTVYAQHRGSVAAPTAGLHFTSELLTQLGEKGVKICYVTLNVGIGTFKPVRAENIYEHIMDSEYYEISDETASIINQARYQNKNIVGVGTTTVRTLESCFKKYGEIKAVQDYSDLFIYPGFKFNIINKIITNFHLPKSTLLMLVSAFAGKDFVFRAYEEAVDKKYRFYSYGDCMFIE